MKSKNVHFCEHFELASKAQIGDSDQVKKLGCLTSLAFVALSHASNHSSTHAANQAATQAELEGCKNTLVIKVVVHMDEVLEMPSDYTDARDWLLYHGPKMRLSDLGNELLRLNNLEKIDMEAHGGIPEDIQAAKAVQEKKNPNQRYLLPMTAVAATEIMRFRTNETHLFSHAQMRLVQRNISREEIQNLLRKKQVSISNVDYLSENYGRLRLSSRLLSEKDNVLGETDTVAIVDTRILRQGKTKIFVPELQVVTVYKDNWKLLRKSIGEELVPALGLEEKEAKKLANFLISLDHKHLVTDVDAERYASDYENLVALLKSEEKAFLAAEFYVKFVESSNQDAAYVLRYYFLPHRP